MQKQQKPKELAQYFEIQLETLRPGHAIPFNLHLYLTTNQHLLLWRKQGEVIQDALLTKCRRAGILKLWIHDKDRKAYEAYLAAAAEAARPAEIKHPLVKKIREIMDSPKLTPQQKKEAAARMAQQILAVSPKPPQELVPAVLRDTTCEAAVQTLELWKYTDQDPELCHGMHVSTYAVLFAMAFGKSDKLLLADLALAGLLHDIGHCRLPLAYARRAWATFTPEDKKAYQVHVEAGIELIQIPSPGMQPLSKRLREMVLQHHEKFDGSGYPKRLDSFSIDGTAQILAIADLMEALCSGRFDGVARSGRESFLFLEKIEKQRTFPEYFDPDLLKKVMDWIRNPELEKAAQEALQATREQTRQLVPGAQPIPGSMKKSA